SHGSTAAPCGSTSRPCTATSLSSGCRGSRWSTGWSRATGRPKETTTSKDGLVTAMAATTRPPDRATRSGSLLVRFDRVERAVHWVNASLFLILVVTGAALYLEPLSRLIGRRALVEDIHTYTGLVLPIPVIAALCGSWGRGLRADLRRFNRWSKDDREWLRALPQPRAERRRRLGQIRLGKFNAGQ